MKPQTSSKIDQSLRRSRESWFSKIAGIFNRPKIEAETWNELEELLIAADVGTATAQKLIQGVKQRAKAEKLEESYQVRDALKAEIIQLLSQGGSKPYEWSAEGLGVILVIGVNGSGKTTSIAKLAYSYKNEGKRVILAAADTFRAAAIEQLRLWGKKAGVDVIAQRPNADPGAVVFDAIQAARNRGVQLVIVDTAGRLHTKFNLMEELKKIKRVIDRQDAQMEVLLVIDATTGQNGLIQARQFSAATGVSGIILTKLDGTARGGIVLAIVDEFKIPIRYIGTGEGLEDLADFAAEPFAEAIFNA